MSTKVMESTIYALIVFNNMIADMISNKNLHPAVTELFISGRKLNITRNFQGFSKEPNDVRLSTTHFTIVKIAKKTRASTNCL